MTKTCMQVLYRWTPVKGHFLKKHSLKEYFVREHIEKRNFFNPTALRKAKILAFLSAIGLRGYQLRIHCLGCALQSYAQALIPC